MHSYFLIIEFQKQKMWFHILNPTVYLIFADQPLSNVPVVFRIHNCIEREVKKQRRKKNQIKKDIR